MNQTFSTEQTAALASLLHHYWYTSYRKTRLSQAKLAQVEFGISGSEFNNFLRQGASGGESGAAEKIAKRLYEIYLEKGEISQAPEYVRRACIDAFPEEIEALGLRQNDVGFVFDESAKSTISGNFDALDKNYPGIYDVYRYAARVISDEPPERQQDEDGNVAFISNAIKSALQIFPRTPGQKYPRFELHYKPYPLSEDRPPRTARGSLVLVERYMYLIGREDAFLSPFYMVCKFDPWSARNFNGLVIQHHDGGGEVFASRVYFRKNDRVDKISELHNELGVIREDHLPEEVQDHTSSFLNDTSFGGKGALLIRG